MAEFGESSVPTIQSTPCRRGVSTVIPERKIDLSTYMSNPWVPVDNESHTFSHVLNASDLDRDEIFCKQNWSYLPLEKFNFSITATENSKITPPNFMPSEDSLFQELQANSNSIFMSSTKQTTTFPDKMPELRISSMKEIQDQEIDSHSPSLDIPSIEDIARAIKGCDDSACSLSLMNEVLRAGDKKSSTSLVISQLNDLKVSEKVILSLEDVINFSCVELNETQLRAVHLVSLNSEEITKYEFCLNGCSDFKVLGTYGYNKDNSMSTVEFQEEIYELVISFSPKKLGPAIACLNISSPLGCKQVDLGGFGGKCKLTVSQFHLASMLEFDRILYFMDSLSSNIELHNLGSAPAFYYINFGELEYYCQTDNFITNRGVIDAGKSRLIKFLINPSKFVLGKLLNFFDSQSEFTSIGKITIHFGEESTRQRLKRLNNFYKDCGITSIISKCYPHLLLDYSEKSFNLEEITDDMNSVPLLIHEGIHQMHFKVCVRKDLVKLFLISSLKKSEHSKSTK